MAKSLAELFTTVKAETKANKGRPIAATRKAKAAAILNTGVADPGDEWLLGLDEAAQRVLEASQYVCEARIVLMQDWVCKCGGHGTDHLGLFLRERSRKLHTLRWRNVGVAFDHSALYLPQHTEFLDLREVDVCNECAEVFGEHQLSLPLNDSSPEQLAGLVGTIVESMLVAKPGFDEYGKRILSPHVCLKEQVSSVTGESVGFVEDPIEQERERVRNEKVRWAV